MRLDFKLSLENYRLLIIWQYIVDALIRDPGKWQTVLVTKLNQAEYQQKKIFNKKIL